MDDADAGDDLMRRRPEATHVGPPHARALVARHERPVRSGTEAAPELSRSLPCSVGDSAPSPACCREPDQTEEHMHGLIYLVGLIVVIMAILSLFGLR
jgi:hypothetical protein